MIKLLDNFKNIVYVFNRINRAFSLLGKSEKNFEVTTILNEFDVSQPFELDFNLKLNEVTNIYMEIMIGSAIMTMPMNGLFQSLKYY